MSSFPPRFFLRPEEQVRLEVRLVGGWAVEVLLAAGLVAGLLGAAAWAFVTYLRPARPGLLLVIAFALALFVLLIAALYVWRRIATTEYVLTDESIYTRRGKVVLTVNSAPLDRITDLHVHTSLAGRALGYSSLSVRTAGGGLHLTGLRDAYHFRGAVHDARTHHVARLLAEAGRRSSPEGPAARGPALQCLCPRCQQVIPVPAQRPVPVTCPNCRLEGVLFEEGAA